MSAALAELPDPRANLAAWEQLWSKWPHQWVLLVKRAEAIWRSIRRPCESDPYEAQPSVFHCDQCQWCGATRQALRMHKTRAHNAQELQRSWVVGSRCPACSSEFWTRARLRQHLSRQGSQMCRMFFLLGGHTPDPAAVEAADLADRAATRSLARRGYHGTAAFVPPVAGGCAAEAP